MERTAVPAPATIGKERAIPCAMERGMSMRDIKPFLKQHKLLTASAVVGAVLIGLGIGRITQGESVPKAPEKADTLEERLAGVGPAPSLKFDEVYTPGQGEQIGLSCSLTYEDRARHFKLWEGEASTRINIDTGRKRWWATNTQTQTVHRTKSVWGNFDGHSMQLSSKSDSEFFVLADTVRPGSDSNGEPIFQLIINRINGEFRGQRQYDDGTVGVYGGHCTRGSFEPQPEKAF